MVQNIEGCNYVEAHIGTWNEGIFLNGISKDSFYNLLQKMKHVDAKSSVYNTRHQSHYYLEKVDKIENEEIAETKVYQSKVLHTQKDPQVFWLYKQRNKVTSVLFPSTNLLHSVCHRKSVVFRVNNRLFVNFVIEKNQREGTIYKVFLNLNLTRDTDISDMSQKINKITDILLPIS